MPITTFRLCLHSMGCPEKLHVHQHSDTTPTLFADLSRLPGGRTTNWQSMDTSLRKAPKETAAKKLSVASHSLDRNSTRHNSCERFKGDSPIMHSLQVPESHSVHASCNSATKHISPRNDSICHAIFPVAFATYTQAVEPKHSPSARPFGCRAFDGSGLYLNAR